MGDHDGLESVITIGWNAQITYSSAGDPDWIIGLQLWFIRVKVASRSAPGTPMNNSRLRPRGALLSHPATESDF
jgi:hypothetical protein